jgi:hypothetical protein
MALVVRKKPIPPKSTGRRPGARNRLTTTVLEIAAASAEKNAAKTLEIVRRKDPALWCKLMFSFVQHEQPAHAIEVGAMSAEEIAEALTLILQLKAQAVNGMVRLPSPTLDLIAVNGSEH